MRVLIGKEVLELRRTFKIVVLPALFIVFGMGGPALIRALPLILKGTETQGMDLELPEFTPADGIAQYLGLVRQLGLLAIIVLFMGIVAGERKDGTLASLFVKPVSRLRYLWCRWGVNAVYIALSFVAGAAVAVLYTLLLLGRPDVSAAAVATLLYLSYLLLAFSWTTLFSSLVRNQGIAAGLSLVPLFVLPLLGTLWKPLGQYGPYGPVAAGTAHIGGAGLTAMPIPTSAVIAVCLDVALSLVLVLAAYRALRHAEL